MKKFEKIISVFLVVILFIGIIPIENMAFGETETIIYQTPTLEVGVVNIKAKGNDKFMREQVYASNYHFNLTNRFTLYSSNNIKDGASTALWYGSSFKHNGNGSGWHAYYKWDYSANPNLKQLISLNQTIVNIAGSLALDNHSNFSRHWSKKKDKAKYSLVQTNSAYNKNILVIEAKNSSDDPDGSPVSYGKNQFYTPLTDSSYTQLLIKLENEGCECGSSKAQSLSFCISDNKYPRITQIYTTDKDGNGKSGFIKDEVCYINLKFSEPIRFANNSIPDFGKYKLNFSLNNTENNQGVTGHGLSADLISLKNDTLTFKFTTPATIGGSNTNYYMTNIIYDQKQNWIKNIGSSTDFDLVTLGAYGTIVPISDTDLTKTSSLITDLSGNPVDWGSCTTDVSPDAYLDNVIPYVKSVEISGDNITKDSIMTDWPKDIDRSAVFAGVGDKVTFHINLNEEINLGSNKVNTIKATLNAKKNGSPIILTAQSSEFIKNNGVNDSINYTRITFESLAVTKEMISAVAKSPLAITNVSVPSGVKDTRGNAVATSIDVSIKPNQQKWLDTLAPKITTSISADSENKYAPIYYDSNNIFEFYIPINITDDISRGTEYTSGSYGAKGKISWSSSDSDANYPFEYYISATSAKPNTANYKKGILSMNSETLSEFTQVDGGNYIHIKLPSDVKYSFNNSRLVVNGTDYAGNVGTSSFNLNYNPDIINPTYEQVSYSTTFNSTTSQGAITAKIKIADEGGINLNNILYQWVDEGDDYVNNDWQVYPSSETGKTKEYLLSLEKGELCDNCLHKYDLWLKCKDLKGNEIIQKFSYMYDLTRAANNIDIVTDPSVPIAHPIIAVGNPIGRDIDGSGVIIPGITMLMIKNPSSSNEYFIRVVSSNNPEYITDILRDTTYDRWYTANVFKGSDGYNFTNVNSMVGNYDNLVYIRDDYYGVLGFTAISGYGIFNSENLSDFTVEDARITVENFNVKSSAITFSEGDTPLHSINVQDALMSDGSAVPIKYTEVPDGQLKGIGYTYVDDSYTPNGEPRFISSLDGIQIPFTITNNIMPEWGVDDVDFESDQTYAALYYTKDGRGIGDYVLEEVCKVALTPNSENQNFVIPDGVANRSGFYCFEISVKAKDKSSYVQTIRNDRIFLSTQRIEDDYGFYGGTVYYYHKLGEDRLSYITSVEKIEDSGVYSNIFNLGTFDSATIQANWTLNFGRYLHDWSNSDKYYERFRSIDYENVEINDNSCFKVWNSADINGYENAHWTRFGHDVVFVNDASEINASMYDAEYEYGNVHVPIIRGVENTLLYQMKLENGITSPVKQLTVNTSNISPSFNVEFSPDKPTDGSMVKEVLGVMQSVFSPNGIYETGCINLPTENNEEPFPPDYSNSIATIMENGNYLFYALDNMGNITTSIKSIDYVDSIAPTVEVVDNGSVGNEFNILVKVTDNCELNGGEIYLSFDEDYSALINNKEIVDSDENTDIITTTVPHNKQGGTWYANSVSNNGIYYTNTTLQTEDGKHIKLVEIRGVFKFDESKGQDETINRSFTITAADKAGVEDLSEEQNPIVLSISSKNIVPKFIDSNLTSESKVNLSFTAPVIIDKPKDTNTKSYYSNSFDTLPIYSDGNYEISYIDMFGKLYTENINLTSYGDFNLKVKVSQEELTNTDVIVSLDTVDKEGLTIEAINGALADDIKISSDKKTASIVMRENGELSVTLKKDGTSINRSIVISNIDKKAPVASEYLYYTAGTPLDDETTTMGPVIAGIICDEDIVGLNGPLTYTFKYKGPTSYTFEFSDLAGNKGELTVNLPLTIKDPNIPDDTAPSYELNAYSKTNNIMNETDTFLSWGSITLENFINSLKDAQAYMLSFVPEDQSHVKLIVKNGTPSTAPSYDDVSDNIEGLVIGESSIVFEKNIECTAFLVDSYGNSTSIPLNITKLDNTAPKTEVIYIPTTFYSIRAYLKEIGVPVDPNGFIITNLSGVNQDKVDGDYKGLYYHDFNENESFIFYYKDGVGNVDTKDALVSVLDTSPARVENIVWTPINPTTTKNLTNKDITAKVQFNKTIKEITLDWANDIDKTKNIDDYVSMVLYNTSVHITYKQNTPMLKLKFISLNSKEATSNLPEVSNIDKVVPKITIGTVNLSKDKKSASFSITSDKEVSFAEGVRPALFATSFTKSVTENGTYICNFTDRSSNQVSITVLVTGIDNEKLVANFNTIASDTGATTKANELNVKVGDTFYMKMNKAGVVLFNSKSTNVTANTWVPFTIEQSTTEALYVIKATDERGDTYYEYLNIAPLDLVAPTVMLKSSTISIMKDADNKALTNALKENLILSDNVTKSENIVSTYDISNVNLNSEGIYTVIYQATDENGNLKEVSGYVRVYGKDDLDITVNGTKAFYNSTIVVTTKNINLDIKNINNEPYTIYYKVGIKTEGQMKIGSTRVTNKSMTLPENGYYTVYVITQSRRSFITYIYVEQ